MLVIQGATALGPVSCVPWLQEGFYQQALEHFQISVAKRNVLILSDTQMITALTLYSNARYVFGVLHCRGNTLMAAFIHRGPQYSRHRRWHAAKIPPVCAKLESAHSRSHRAPGATDLCDSFMDPPHCASRRSSMHELDAPTSVSCQPASRHPKSSHCRRTLGSTDSLPIRCRDTCCFLARQLHGVRKPWIIASSISSNIWSCPSVLHLFTLSNTQAMTSKCVGTSGENVLDFSWGGLTQEIYIALKNTASQQKVAIVLSRVRSIFRIAHPPSTLHCLSTLWLSCSPPVPENSPPPPV